MKKQYLYISLIFLTMMGSCSEEDITRLPQGGLNPASFWKNADDAWLAVNNLYTQMPASASGNTYKAVGTDLMTGHHHPWAAGPYLNLQNATMNAATPYLNGHYSYTTIRATNYAIENLSNLSTEIIDDQLKRRYIAESRVIRAWKYMDLTLKFGNVFLTTEVIAPENAIVSRTPASEVQTFIIAELEAASMDLPSAYTGGYENEIGRLTKGAALSLQARAALYFGDYATAETASLKVMNDFNYDLHTITDLSSAQLKEIELLSDYVDFDNLLGGVSKDEFIKGIFSYRTIWYGENTTNNSEYIITDQYIPKTAPYSYHPVLLVPGGLYAPRLGHAEHCPTQSLVNSYWMSDGVTKVTAKSYDQRKVDFKAAKDLTDNPGNVETANAETTLYDAGHAKTLDYFKEFSDRDSRFYASIGFPFAPTAEMTDAGYDTNNTYEWDRGWNGRGITGYWMRKTLDPYNARTPELSGFGNSTLDFPLFRFSEILLIYAEARTQNSGYDGTVQSALNRIRLRAGMPNVPSGLAGTAALNFIHNERIVELAGEGHRIWDIRRYERENASYENSASNVLNTTVYDVNKANGRELIWSPTSMLFAIPQSALDNNPELSQNPGY